MSNQSTIIPRTISKRDLAFQFTVRNVEIIHFQESLLSVPLPRNLNPYLDTDYGMLRDFKLYLANEFPILSFLCM